MMYDAEDSKEPDGSGQRPAKRASESRNPGSRGVSVCQWQTSCEPTEAAAETLPPGGFLGQSPKPPEATLTLEGGASNPKVAQNLTPSSQARQRKYFAPPPGTPHKPQPAARFRKLGKRCFPNFRREADASHPRWEAKRPRKLPLTQKAGANGQV